ncbi:predicted protein [Botrytis cinerea T4]|uniref:Uncharacterized protein n=1 Tax=Botryotinia fuckeliana (strain T4) TaxID=999810 RepID=G2XYH1_BOTF4|nr:predicted protein [Botrytis cinerea T4]
MAVLSVHVILRRKNTRVELSYLELAEWMLTGISAGLEGFCSGSRTVAAD